ncbi:MAG: DUF1501 domain-containing protein [Zavarzinella sp.]
MMHHKSQIQAELTRRALFSNTAGGLGTFALADLLHQSGAAQEATTALPGLPHFAPKAKRVIYLFMNGAPPHLDTFDYKPKMEKFRGQEIPDRSTRINDYPQ